MRSNTRFEFRQSLRRAVGRKTEIEGTGAQYGFTVVRTGQRQFKAGNFDPDDRKGRGHPQPKKTLPLWEPGKDN